MNASYTVCVHLCDSFMLVCGVCVYVCVCDHAMLHGDRNGLCSHLTPFTKTMDASINRGV